MMVDDKFKSLSRCKKFSSSEVTCHRFAQEEEEVVMKPSCSASLFLLLLISLVSLLFVIIGNYQSFLIKTLDVTGTSQRLITCLVVSISVQRLLFGCVRRPISLEEATLQQKKIRVTFFQSN